MSAKTKETKAEVKRARRLWKAKRSLPSAEWDPKQKRFLFEFHRGFFETEDDALADELVSRGYMEVTPEMEKNLPPKPPLEDLPDPDALPSPFKPQPETGTAQALLDLGMRVPTPGGG